MPATDTDRQALDSVKSDYKYGWSQPESYAFKSRKGLDHDIVEQISQMKHEPDWMRQLRHEALDIFLSKPIPTWGADLSAIDYQDIYYYIKPVEAQGKSWDDVPADIKETFDKLGIPEAERKFLAGAGAQYESEAVYHSLKQEWEKQGVIFVDSDSGLREHPEIYKEYFGTVVPSTDNVFAALNTACWSGGSFVYVPKGVHLDIPLQAYFRINAQSMGQFERTLIIVDEGASVHYVEGCFLAGARVRTRGGEKAIEQIQVGDEVLTHRGRYRKVYHTMQRPYQGSVYRVRYFGDSAQELQVTEEHPLLVARREQAHERNRQFAPEWLTAAEVKPSDYLAIPVPRGEASSDDAHRTIVPVGRGRHAPVQREVTLPLEPDFYRLLGYYYAEGHVDNEHYLTFSFNVAETEYLEDVKELFGRYFGLTPTENKPRQNGQTLVFASTQVARAFANEFGSTVYDKHVPEWVRNASTEHLAQLVRGMWCGDGSYDPKKNMFRFNTVSRDFAYTFRDALLRLGIAASVNLQPREEPRKDIYAVVISSPWNAKFGAIVGCPAPNGSQSGSPFYLDEQYLYVPIRAIEIENRATTVYNFSVEEDESYVGEGVVSHNCTAPTYSNDSLHSGVIEIIVRKGARCRYTTIQNWSTNVYNLVTQRSLVYEGGTMEWVDANMGSKITMKYPSIYMLGDGAHGQILSMAFAGPGQHLDTGGKLVHAAPNTSSQLISKSISKGGGRASYRGLLKVSKGAHGAKSNVVCDALLLDERSRSDTYPYIEIDEDDITVGHEASVSKIGEEQLFYLQSRGLAENEASAMIVAGFIEPMVKELPMEYAVELNRLIQLQMEGSVG
ncbi:MAG: Fe-S cluster assembly protein SufB [Chloroflexi bacterium]|nr:Fe-S cluster assembly protein SufB [Chloroflexota bacterium]